MPELLIEPVAVLAVDGHLPRPRRFDARALRELPRRELGPLQIDCYSGRSVGHVAGLAGVRLTDLLDAAGFSTQPRSELKRCVVIAGARDGYRAIFSWNELYNSPLGRDALVVYELDGRPLPQRLGALCLVSAGDARLGPRHLRDLQSVSAQRL